MGFVETSVFAKRIDALLSQDEQWFLQAALLANPELGAVIQGSGGILYGGLSRDEQRANGEESESSTTWLQRPTNS